MKTRLRRWFARLNLWLEQRELDRASRDARSRGLKSDADWFASQADAARREREQL